ncbi:MAG: hypothetical protein ACRDHE_03685 [Ktedonobacterales bacterium]
MPARNLQRLRAAQTRVSPVVKAIKAVGEIATAILAIVALVTLLAVHFAPALRSLLHAVGL